ncbi:MAG: PQQ-binding-like beta-propeller repeat protein [Solirubrobacteraceae bacterium]
MTTPPSFFRRRRRLLIVLGAAVLVLLLAALGGYLYVHGHEPGEVHNSTVEFQNEKPQAPVAPRRGAAFAWPDYGYTKDRRRYLPASADLRPPFKTIWAIQTRDLVEFPPVLAHRRLFLLKNNGTMWALGANNGHLVWKRKVGAQAAASPSVAGGVVYAVVLKRLHRVPKGRVAAYTQRRGRLLWSRPLRSRSESSPVYANGMLFFGAEDGTVYGLNARNGHIRWTYRAPGAVKSGLALRNGILYFGDYSGHVQAVRASNGHKVWSAKTSGAKFGFSSGQFYSTPAVAFGRVYLGNTDGFVYSFATTNGKLAWSKKTSRYVYASPAVADIPHFGPTVYVGSYDGTFYALDARAGKVRWQRKAGGRISGSATIVGNVVYFANLAKRTTIGLAVRSGATVLKFPHGGFNPVISDGRKVYLTGYASLYGLIPKTAAQRAAARRRIRERHARERRAKRVAKRKARRRHH